MSRSRRFSPEEAREAARAMVVEEGVVEAKSTGRYRVRVGREARDCGLSSQLRKLLIYPTADPASRRHRVEEVRSIRQIDPVAVGDCVRFVDDGTGGGMITEVLPRRNRLSRRAGGTKPIEQVIVANVDRVIPVIAAAEPTANWYVLDRYLVEAEASELPVLICLAKLDLADREEIEEEVEVYRRLGYDTLLTSAETGEGVAEMRRLLAGRLSVLFGPSGVGKSTLLNAVEPGLELRTGEISEKTGKGKHTTTSLAMHPLRAGGWVVDTPGMREFGVWSAGAEELPELFREFVPHLDGCRFGPGCSHTHEPGCAVKEAVDAGTIAERRYESYCRLLGG